MKRLIKSVRMPDGKKKDILIENDFIVGVEDQIDTSCEEIVAAEGWTALPALTDIHVHFRDPGYTCKEDILSGAAAAAAGGVTTVFAMPNTNPSCDTPETIRYILEKAAGTGIDVFPVAAITRGLLGSELTDIQALKAAGAAALSDDGRPVLSAELMEQAMQIAKELNLPILAHCEDLKQAGQGIINRGKVSEALGVMGIPNAAEEDGTRREIMLAEKTGYKVHICHVSTKGSVEMIRAAKAKGIQVTAETAPHYFTLTERSLLQRDADFRMNPPLRREEDQQAILEGLQDGTIDAIATDHAPHTPEEKRDFIQAPNGVVGLETSLAVSLTYLVNRDVLPLQRLIELMVTNPRKICGLPENRLEPGYEANLILVDRNETWTVNPEKFRSKARNSCFKGMNLTGRVKYTIRGDRVLYQDK